MSRITILTPNKIKKPKCWPFITNTFQVSWTHVVDSWLNANEFHFFAAHIATEQTHPIKKFCCKTTVEIRQNQIISFVTLDLINVWFAASGFSIFFFFRRQKQGNNTKRINNVWYLFSHTFMFTLSQLRDVHRALHVANDVTIYMIINWQTRHLLATMTRLIRFFYISHLFHVSFFYLHRKKFSF